MSSPSFLKKGDKVALVATARKITREEISFAIKTLESWGLKIVPGKNIFKAHHQFAGTDERRAEDFQQMLDDGDIKAVFCARGGYGTVRIIDEINFNEFKRKPKWIAGYSDITVLHAHIFSNFKIPTIHATMPINFKKNTREALESLRKALFGEPLEYAIPPHKLNRKGMTEGTVVGGNLSLLHTLAGTRSEVDTANKILFIEDLDEYLYHIDRMMMQMKRSGKLKNLHGLIVGGLTKMKDNDLPTGGFGKTAEEIIFEKVADYKYPVCFGFPAGHLDDNRALYIGKKARLTVKDSAVSLAF